MVVGISAGNERAIDLFVRITGAVRYGGGGRGNAILDGRDVQIRLARTTTVNQVRAIRYLPVVTYYERADRWYVVPPHVIVAMVTTKPRGQHQEMVYESATLSVEEFSDYEVSEPLRNLRSETLRVIQEGDQHPEIRQVLQEVRDRTRAFAEEMRGEVSRVLIRFGL